MAGHPLTVMLEVELDPLERNEEAALKVRKAPAWRYGFLITTFLLWSASLPIIMNSSASPLFAGLTAIGVLVAMGLVVWYVFTNRVSGLHSAGLTQIVSSQRTKYQYCIEDGLIRKDSDVGRKSWKPSELVGTEIGHGYAILIFRTAVCYLPFRGAGRQQVVDFVKNVEQLARS